MPHGRGTSRTWYSMREPDTQGSTVGDTIDRKHPEQEDPWGQGRGREYSG
jgi:hypothetical protein